MLALATFAACASANTDTDLLSGTVRLDPESGDPAGGAFVRVVDSNKVHRCFVTACDGTFALPRNQVPPMQMPLVEVSIERVAEPSAPWTSPTLAVTRMRGAVREIRSCNGCHARGVSFFQHREDVPLALRNATRDCTAESIPVVCPEDRVVPDDDLEIIRDVITYTRVVHAAMERRCGGSDCHASEDRTLRISFDQETSYASVTALNPELVMNKARARVVDHGGGAVVAPGDVTDQCIADWLGAPREPSVVKMTHPDACRRAAE
jgi:hypothetical protein